MAIMQEELGINLKDMDFMSSAEMNYKNENVIIRLSRCGYTGEDGFEVSIPNKALLAFVEKLTSKKEGGN